MAGALVQQKVATRGEPTTATTLTVTPDAATTTGNLLVLCVGLASSGTTISGVSDSAGNTWVQGADAISSGGSLRRHAAIWYCANAASVTSVTITVSANDYIGLNLSEWSGMATSSVVDVTATSTPSATATTIRTGSATPTTSVILVGCTTVAWEANAPGSLTAGWTGLTDYNAASYNRAAYKAASGTAQEATWTVAVAQVWAGALVAFKEAAGGSTLTVTRDTTDKKFGTASLRGVKTGAAGEDKYTYQTVGVLPSTSYSISAWVKVTGYSGNAISNRGLYVRELNGATELATHSATLTANTTGYERKELNITTNASTSSLEVRLYWPVATTRWDGVQVEQTKVVTPFIATSTAAATRPAGRVELPVTLFNPSQGWIALRARTGWSSTVETGQGEATLFSWIEDANDYMSIGYRESDNKIVFKRTINGVTTEVASSALTPTDGQKFTVIGAWETASHKISIDGAAFTSAASSAVSLVTEPQFDIGSFGGINHWDGEVLWVATGRGTLANGDATTLHNFGDTDPTFGGLPATPSALWTATNELYQVPPSTRRRRRSLMRVGI